jgi:hypothetical protein
VVNLHRIYIYSYKHIFSSLYGTNQRVLNAIIEGQAFSPVYDLAPPPSPPPPPPPSLSSTGDTQED